MKAIRTHIPDDWLIEPRVFGDERGFFFESFNEYAFNAATGNTLEFVQDNQSKLAKCVLRGLNYQQPSKTQGKLVRVVEGEVFDVAVDIRKYSSTYGQCVGEIMCYNSKKQLWIPPGLAHWFCTLSNAAGLLCKTTNYRSPEYQREILWNDATLKIDWLLNGLTLQLAAKDAAAVTYLSIG